MRVATAWLVVLALLLLSAGIYVLPGSWCTGAGPGEPLRDGCDAAGGLNVRSFAVGFGALASAVLFLVGTIMVWRRRRAGVPVAVVGAGAFSVGAVWAFAPIWPVVVLYVTVFMLPPFLLFWAPSARRFLGTASAVGRA